MIYQQGDVLLTKIDSLPLGNKVERKERGYILAEGEATGHAHVIEEEIEMVEKDGTHRTRKLPNKHHSGI
jgi:hypothetical protein